MRVACLCCTYGRPHLLPEAIESFLRQTYEPRELIILDDAGQYTGCVSRWPNVKVVSIPYRFATLGEKRNACAALASPGTDLYAVWDDDDIYLPRHLELAVAALATANADIVIPSVLFVCDNSKLALKRNRHIFHGSWVFRRSMFIRCPYPAMQSGQDQAMLAKMRAERAKVVYTSEPTYIYRFHGIGPHLSTLPKGDAGYNKFHELVSGALSTRPEELQAFWSKDWENEARLVCASWASSIVAT